jgi:Right handed beta helix region
MVNQMRMRAIAHLWMLCLLVVTSMASSLDVSAASSAVPPILGAHTEDLAGSRLDTRDQAWASSPSPVAYLAPLANNLWVDAVNGKDSNNGLTASTALKNIQTAANRAVANTTVHILPGVYRETVWPANDGAYSQPIIFRAENGPGTVLIRGSQPSSSLTWSQLGSNTIGLPSGINPGNIYYADLSAWGLTTPPRFVVELDTSGQPVAPLPLAREPDWQVTTEWKYHEFWWAADGGSTMAGCVPTPGSNHECDRPSRSTTQLTDRTTDTSPAGIEAGNLTTLNNLVGATLVAMDNDQGHYVYRRTIVSHDKANGRITVDPSCGLGSGSSEPGLGWGTKYYVEGKPSLLDNPGEWWYDSATKRLYLWPRTAGSPAAKNIEISVRDYGFLLEDLSYITLDGLTLDFFNDTAVYQLNHRGGRSYDNTVRNSTLRYANYGVQLQQAADGAAGDVSDGFTLLNSTVAYMDTQALHLTYWWASSSADTFNHAGIINTVIQGNELHHLGFRSEYDNAVGAAIFYADRLSFVGNHVHHVAHNGIQFLRSIIQSSKQYGFAPSEIKTGEILIKDNIFEKACLIGSDCGALKIWGVAPDYHVFRDLLVTGNVFRNTFGWAYVAEKRGHWTAGSSSAVKGMGGFGLYVDNASGVHAYRNIAYNNAFAGFWFYGNWRDGDIVYYNNVAANSLYGFNLGAPYYDTHGNWNTQVVNNIVVNSEGYGVLLGTAHENYSNLTIDHNLYYSNGWRPSTSGGLWKPGDLIIHRAYAGYLYYQTLAQIQSNTSWEDHGKEGDPRFSAYNVGDHEFFDGSWPDLHPTSASANVIDKGTTNLPASLQALLTQFGVQDQRTGSAFDIGRYEAGFGVKATPSGQAIDPGGVARYVLRLEPSDLSYAVTLNTASPSSYLAVDLRPTTITSLSQAILTITDSHTGPLMPGRWYAVPITGIGGGLTQTTSVGLVVGGARTYLPVITRATGR